MVHPLVIGEGMIPEMGEEAYMEMGQAMMRNGFSPYAADPLAASQSCPKYQKMGKGSAGLRRPIPI